MTLREGVRALRYLPSDVLTCTGVRDGLRFWLARHFGRPRGRQVVVHPRLLAGAPLALRPWTSDPHVAWYVLNQRAQLPPAGMNPVSILDLGANIGVSAAMFAVHHPSARIVAVEPDAGNAELARRNTGAWSDRCTVVEGAAWPTRARLALAGPAEDSLRVGASGTPVQTIPIAELAALAAVEGALDFVKVNVEGAERQLLEDASWATTVAAVRVEVHEPYTAAECVRDLERAGFTAAADAVGPWVSGVRGEGGGVGRNE